MQRIIDKQGWDRSNAKSKYRRVWHGDIKRARILTFRMLQAPNLKPCFAQIAVAFDSTQACFRSLCAVRCVRFAERKSGSRFFKMGI
jgi:hypothetical protein